MIAVLVQLVGPATRKIAGPAAHALSVSMDNETALAFRRLPRARVEGGARFTPEYVAFIIRESATVVPAQHLDGAPGRVLVDELPAKLPHINVDGVTVHVSPQAFRFDFVIAYDTFGGGASETFAFTDWLPWSVFDDALGVDP